MRVKSGKSLRRRRSSGNRGQRQPRSSRDDAVGASVARVDADRALGTGHFVRIGP